MNTHGIVYPSKPSEFEIQAELYCVLREYTFDARGEVHAGAPGARGRCDIVVFDKQKQPMVLIEVKPMDATILNTQQMWYSRLGVPVLYCMGMGEIPETVKQIRAIKRSRAESAAVKAEMLLMKIAKERLDRIISQQSSCTQPNLQTMGD